MFFFPNLTFYAMYDCGILLFPALRFLFVLKLLSYIINSPISHFQLSMSNIAAIFIIIYTLYFLYSVSCNVPFTILHYL